VFSHRFLVKGILMCWRSPVEEAELDVEAGPVKDVERVDEVEPVEEMEPVMEARQDPGELPK
jgi:hypothetical protein